jgi:hypothetical protein
MGMMQNEMISLKIDPNGQSMPVPMSQLMQMPYETIMSLAKVNPGPIGELLQKMAISQQVQDPNYQQGQVPTTDSKGNTYYKQRPAIPVSSLAEQMPNQLWQKKTDERIDQYSR